MSAPTIEEALARIAAAMDVSPGVLSIVRIGTAYRGKLDVSGHGTMRAQGETLAAVLVRLGYLCDPPA